MNYFGCYGQNCFKTLSSSAILTDPHDGKTVDPKSPQAGSTVLVTKLHDHHDHAIRRVSRYSKSFSSSKELGEIYRKGCNRRR